ncbi:hypothetical protein [Hyalangium sp.]|uniref:hypothetical protein n=1 Tax=Hyalangium sp. TaxID=2028555 RepID=UPI002D4615EA|nr:hypothetical protein [Hyalangium sp.]HYH97970.1 hypothetical protein [Hyalangium sp.]
MRVHGSGVMVLLLALGCAQEGALRPAPTALSLTADASTIVGEAHGVRLLANGSSWESYPKDLDDHLTPVELVLENRSGRPLNVRLRHFALVGEARHEALSQAAMDQFFSTRATRIQAPPPHTGQRLPNTPLAVGGHPSDGADRTYTRTNGTNDVRYAGPPCISCMPPAHGLTEPSADMVRQAFHEGAVPDGGTQAGFLYFPPLDAREGQVQVQLQATLEDARTGEAFGTLSLPLQIR